MKKIIYLLLAVCSLALTAVSCSEDNQLSTNQYKGGISLNVFGPSPVARGGQIRFVGSGLSQVTSVVFPGGYEVTDITVLDEKSIMVTVPKEGPEVGRIVLKYPGGELTTTSDITYTEPISLTKFSPATVKAGDLLTIEGDYLNLMHAVIFSKEDTLTEEAFQEHTRYKISLYVPAEAQTGRIAISDAAETPNVIESDEILNVTLPAVASVLDLTGKKPGDKITITGTDFDLIASLMVGGIATEYTLNDKATEITFTLPDATPDKAAIAVYPASGVEVILAYIGMKLPSELQATPANGLRSGDKIVITGKDLDVVSSVTFPGVEEAVTPTYSSATALNVTAPDKFVSGDLVLNCKSGATQTLAIETAKPEFTEYSPVPVSAGNNLIIRGHNLDLVSKIVFAENCEVEKFNAQSAEALEVTVPVTAVSGVLNITMGNGEAVEFAELSVNSPEFCFIPELPADSIELKAGEMMSVTIVNGDKLTGVKMNGTDCQYILQGSTLYIGIPDNATSSTTLTLISSNGSVDYTLAVTPNTESTTVIWTGAVDLNNWSFNWQFGDNTISTGENAKAFADMGLVEGDVIRIYATNYNDWWQVQFFDGHWNAQNEIGNATGLNNNNNINSGIYNLAEHNGYIEIPVTATLAEQLTTLNDWGYCWIMQGEGIIISKITATHYTSLEKSVWTGDITLGWSAGGRVCVPASVFEGIKANSVLRFYYKNYDLSVWGCFQINDGSWAGINFTSAGKDGDCSVFNQQFCPNDGSAWSGILEEGVLKVCLTSDILDQILSHRGDDADDGATDCGLIVQGSGPQVYKVTLE